MLKLSKFCLEQLKLKSCWSLLLWTTPRQLDPKEIAKEYLPFQSQIRKLADKEISYLLHMTNQESAAIFWSVTIIHVEGAQIDDLTYVNRPASLASSQNLLHTLAKKKKMWFLDVYNKTLGNGNFTLEVG